MFSGKSGSRAAAPVKRGGRTRVLRIVGGTWRGRKLRFPASAAIRPTPDRVRETLFNWLGTRTPGARALDLFAGSEARTFDLVFLDPPFTSGLLGEAARMLEEHHWLEPGALIYVECAAREGLPPLPAPWRELKAKQAGEVGYHLFAHTAPLAADTE